MKRTHWILISMSLIIALFTLDSSGWGGGRGNGGGRGGFRGGGGGFYHGFRGSYGWGGGFGTYLPNEYTSVIVDGSPYYYSNGYYLTPNSSEYVVVPEPVAAIPAAPAVIVTDVAQTSKSPAKYVLPDTTTINVPNSKGGFTPVRLVKHENGFVGPEGEYYPGHPTIDELKVLYGN